MKKRSILTVLVALFLVSLISCNDNIHKVPGDETPSYEGIISYTPKAVEDNASLFYLGYHLRGTGKQKSLFNRCERDMSQPNTLVMECDVADINIPSAEPASLVINSDLSKDITYTAYYVYSSNLLACFDYDRKKPTTCNVTKDQKTSDSPTNIYLGFNHAKLEEIKNAVGVEMTLRIANNATPSVDKNYKVAIDMKDLVTPECVGGSTLDPDIPNNYLCNDQSKGKFVITNNLGTTTAAFSVWDFLTEGSKDGFIENLEIKFADDFFTIFDISTRTTCHIVDNVVSIDKNCQVFIDKRDSDLTGESTLNITGTLSSDKVSPGKSINAVYTFVAE